MHEMTIESELHDLAMDQGADYYGVADLTSAADFVSEQGGPALAGCPRAVSIGIGLLHPFVDGLCRHIERPAAVSYRSHCYEVINTRLDLLVSRLAGVVQRRGWRAYPVAASRRIDDERLCAIFPHKLAAHLAGLGFIGKNCLLVTPGMGPRVRWATLLTDAPLTPTGEPMAQRCGDCRLCVDICPVRAFTGRPFTAEEPRSARFDAGRCDRYFSMLRKKDPETAVCGLCLQICPYGNRHRPASPGNPSE
jgi:epoxyqueuosine reductase QueG